jgi:hypothetical protein
VFNTQPSRPFFFKLLDLIGLRQDRVLLMQQLDNLGEILLGQIILH